MDLGGAAAAGAARAEARGEREGGRGEGMEACGAHADDLDTTTMPRIGARTKQNADAFRAGVQWLSGWIVVNDPLRALSAGG